jgi:glycosyltransferase involved in cell wall biosynthesis
MTEGKTEPANIGQLRVALVHDWLTGMRGGEKVLEAIYELVPDAKLFTLLHVPGSVSPTLESCQTSTSLIQKLPMSATQYRRYIPIFPWVIEQFDLDCFDLVISTSHCAAKSVIPTGRARHLCYCFTPMRYAWDQFDAYFGSKRVGRIQNQLYREIFSRLARWDTATSGRVSRYVADSQHVAGRINRYYNRNATVVHPPVDTDFYYPNDSDRDTYFLVVSALVPYKRIDLAIEACRRTGMPLKIVGSGPERERLQTQSGADVEFLGARSADEIRALYRSARGVLLPGEEDFGIVAVEAMSCGTPVIGLDRGGTTETIIEGISGVLVKQLTPDSFAAGITRTLASPFDTQAIRSHALRFSQSRFIDTMRCCIEETAHAQTLNPEW